ncbi:hypothetical protein B7R54_08405 [Subtercola boreus]|uniref:Uncharacterized protein n=1 Tax=Subtercola boreus TaxID=120213 RepID=A0A3E0VH33_9MICO|nr:hypothetical protein B7R54_08405 [Subtercola boreus]TQL53729.1 hypothetical protein FB464_1246 [Subtercola boreus]
MDDLRFTNESSRPTQIVDGASITFVFVRQLPSFDHELHCAEVVLQFTGDIAEGSRASSIGTSVPIVNGGADDDVLAVLLM